MGRTIERIGAQTVLLEDRGEGSDAAPQLRIELFPLSSLWARQYRLWLGRLLGPRWMTQSCAQDTAVLSVVVKDLKGMSPCVVARSR